MFAQVISGRTNDADRLHHQIRTWAEQLRPAAVGFLGSTGGVTDDGRVVLVARFESGVAAKQNADRPSQTEWWEATRALFTDEPQFVESEDVDVIGEGGHDDAGFVQVMRGRTSDRSRLSELSNELTETLLAHRPDFLGGVTVWDGDDYTEVAYFTDEAAARQSEANPPKELEEAAGEWRELMGDVEYFDLRTPWLL